MSRKKIATKEEIAHELYIMDVKEDFKNDLSKIRGLWRMSKTKGWTSTQKSLENLAVGLIIIYHREIYGEG